MSISNCALTFSLVIDMRVFLKDESNSRFTENSALRAGVTL